MSNLDQTTESHLKHLCANGYRLYDQRDYKEALRIFYQAWLLLPKPQSQWYEAGWVLTAIGDTYYRLGQYEQGKEALLSAQHCQNIDDNPFVNLRLGQCLFELGEHGAARRALNRAYTLGGSELFQPEDKKYREMIDDLVEPSSTRV